MSRVTCRCGEVITLKTDARPERIACPKCGSRIRLRRRPNSPPAPAAGSDGESDGYIRFHCPCGRRLKVRARDQADAGKCPDCGRVVPIPDSARVSPGATTRARVDPDARTEDMDPNDMARLDEWITRHTGRTPGIPGGEDATPTGITAIKVAPASPAASGLQPSMVKFEAGLRVCPRCGKPVHMSAVSCRECGAAVPRK